MDSGSYAYSDVRGHADPTLWLRAGGICHRFTRGPNKPPNFRHFQADELCGYAGVDAFREQRPQRCAEHRGHGIDILFSLGALVEQKEHLRCRMFEPTVSRITIAVHRDSLLARPD